MVSYVVSLDIGEIKEIIELYNYCISYLESVDTNDLNYGKLKEVLRNSDILLKDDKLNEIPPLNVDKINNHDYLKKLVVDVLNKSFCKQKLGDLLIRDFLDSNMLLSYSCILYDIEKQKSKYNLDDIEVHIDLDASLDNHGGVAILEKRIIELNFLNNQEDSNYSYYNIFILTSIRHEICHFLQDEKYQKKEFTSLLDRLYLQFDYEAIECRGLYETLHDYFPTEYHAIEFSYLTLYEDVTVGDYQNINTNILKNLILGKLKDLRFKELFNYNEREYPYCNLCPRLRKIIELACYFAVSVNDFYYVYKLILKYQEIYNYIKNNFQDFEIIEEDFLLNFNFNVDYIVNYNNMKKYIVSYKVKDKNIVNNTNNLVLDFESYLKSFGYSDEDIYNVYCSYYKEDEELFNALFIKLYLTNNESKSKLLVRR